MRKKVVSILIIITVFVILFSYNDVFAMQNLIVKLPSFKVTINGEETNNIYSQYPLITYKDITYFPMTYDGCRYLGLETKWDEKNGLEINKTNVSYPYNKYTSKTKNTGTYYATTPKFNIKINGKAINNQQEEYPLLVFRDVTYFPLTWKYGVEEFGWDYHFDSVNGLVIKSQNNIPIVKQNNIFINNTANSKITTKVTALSQYKYGVAKICVDDRWFYIDKQGNEVNSLNDLSIVNNINIPNAKPLIEYKEIEKVDDVLILKTDDFIQCVDLNNGNVLFEAKGVYYYYLENRSEEPDGYGKTILGNNQRAFKLAKDNEELTIIVNVDTKEVYKVNCYQSKIQEGLYEYKKNGLFGFKNIYNQVVIQAKHPQSSRNTLFSDGMALMQKSPDDDRTFVFYDRNGNIAFEIYLDYQDEISEFKDGLAKIGRKYLYGFIDKTGKVIIEPQYFTATKFSKGVAIVSVKGKYGVIYSNGEVAIPLEYESMKSNVFQENGRYYDLNPNYPMLARKDGKWGYVSFPGVRKVWSEEQENYSYEKQEPRPVVPFIYDNYPERDVRDLPLENSGYNLYYSPYAVFKIDEKYYAIGVTLEGKVLTPEGYDIMGYDYEFKYGLMHVMKDGKMGFLNTEFELVIPLKYTSLAYFNNYYTNPPYFMEDVACVKNGEKLILIDRQGNELLYFN